jgi:hypothetical protein
MNQKLAGKMAARWKIWCVLDKMENKYPMTGHPDKLAGYKNGWYDEVLRLKHKLALRRRK